MHEASYPRLVWDALGVALVVYDLVATPFSLAFRPPENAVFGAALWVMPVFWTLDVAVTFLTGYVHRGVDELHLGRIAVHYARTTLALDFPTAVFDWLLLVLPLVAPAEVPSVALHTLQVLRLARVLKVRGKLSGMALRIQSEDRRIAMSLVCSVAALVLCSHVVACGFYGVVTAERDRGDTLAKESLEGRELGYRYLVSLEWSLARFTPAPMEGNGQTVRLATSPERTYAVCTTLLALAALVVVAGRVAGAAARLGALHRRSRGQLAALRWYLRENHVAARVRHRIWSWLEHEDGGATEPCVRDDVAAVLARLPQGLQWELQDQVYMPVLARHPFFCQFVAAHPQEARRLNSCVERVFLAPGQALFAPGERAEGMYFVIEGRLRYAVGPALCAGTAELAAADREVSAGQWASEPALWVDWVHCGRLTAASYCEVFGLRAEVFQVLMQRQLGIRQAAKYARAYDRYAQEQARNLTDIFADLDALRALADGAFFNGDGGTGGSPHGFAKVRVTEECD